MTFGHCDKLGTGKKRSDGDVSYIADKPVRRDNDIFFPNSGKRTFVYRENGRDFIVRNGNDGCLGFIVFGKLFGKRKKIALSFVFRFKVVAFFKADG